MSISNGNTSWPKHSAILFQIRVRFGSDTEAKDLGSRLRWIRSTEVAPFGCLLARHLLCPRLVAAGYMFYVFAECAHSLELTMGGREVPLVFRHGLSQGDEVMKSCATSFQMKLIESEMVLG